MNADELRGTKEYRLVEQKQKEGLTPIQTRDSILRNPNPSLELDMELLLDAVRLVYEKDRTLPLLDVISAKDLLALDLPEPQWIIPGILAEGLSILVGKPKMGKSFLALNMSIAVGAGIPILGQEPMSRGVLYLALEDSKSRLQTRMITVLNGSPPPDKVFFKTDWPKFNAQGLTLLKEYLKIYPDTKLVIVDTLERIRPDSAVKGNAYQVDYHALKGIHGFVLDNGLSMVLVHHTRKEWSEDSMDSVSGSTGLTAAADEILILSRGRGSTEAELFISGRDVEEETLVLQFDKETCWWKLLGKAEDCSLSNERKDILDLVSEHKEGLSPKEISSNLGKDGNTIRQLLKKMYDAGQLSRIDGKYQEPVQLESITHKGKKVQIKKKESKSDNTDNGNNGGNTDNAGNGDGAKPLSL